MSITILLSWKSMTQSPLALDTESITHFSKFGFVSGNVAVNDQPTGPRQQQLPSVEVYITTYIIKKKQAKQLNSAIFLMRSPSPILHYQTTVMQLVISGCKKFEISFDIFLFYHTKGEESTKNRIGKNFQNITSKIQEKPPFSSAK